MIDHDMRFWVYILLPDIVVSIIAKTAGFFFKVSDIRTASAVEGRIRGLLMKGRFGAQRLFVGEAVHFSGERRIQIGKDVTIHPGSQIVAGKGGYVKMGDRSHISRNTVLAGSGGIEVGDHCKISSGVMIYSVTYDRTKTKLLRDASALHEPVKIGADVHIGANATILPGVTIGNNAVIGAGAVVSRDVTADTTVIGVPARPVKKK